VVTHSSGNHAGALALAAQMRGVPSYIVVPEGAPQCKLDAIATYGGVISRCKATVGSCNLTPGCSRIGCALFNRLELKYDEPL
jgi:serine racemase